MGYVYFFDGGPTLALSRSGQRVYLSPALQGHPESWHGKHAAHRIRRVRGIVNRGGVQGAQNGTKSNE